MKSIFTTLILFTILFAAQAQQKVDPEAKGSLVTLQESQLYLIQKIYPNPASDIVNVEIKAVNPENIRISLYNIMGVEVKKWDMFNIMPGGQVVNLDLSEFKSGVYVLKFTNGSRVISNVIRKS